MKWIRPATTRLALLCALLLAIQALLAPLPTSAEKRPPPKQSQVDRRVTVADVVALAEGGYTATIDGRPALVIARTSTAPELLNGSWFNSTLTTHYRIVWRKRR